MPADSTIFYAGWPIMELADLDSVSYEVTGFDGFHLFDGSLKTKFAKISAQDPVTIVLDLNKTDLPSAVYAFGIFVYNYTTDHSNSGASSFEVEFSSDGTTWDAAVIDQNITDSDEPIHIFETASAITPKRYVRFTFTSFTTTMYVTQIFLARKITVSAGPEIQSTEQTDYFNIAGSGRGSRSGQHVSAVLRDGVKSYKRTYVGTSSIIDDIELLYEWARGSRGLVIAMDSLNGTSDTPHVVRLTDKYEPEPIASGVWRVAIEMQDVPYYTDGYNY